MYNFRKLLLLLPLLLLGCDFAVEPDNEYILSVISVYETRFDLKASADLHDCMKTFTLSYVDHVDGAPSSSGATSFSPFRRDIQISTGYPSKTQDGAITHEYIHALLFCLGQDDVNNEHKNPDFWTCNDSIENLVAHMYGNIADNTRYITRCDPEEQPSNYHPGR
jgi:hypothetical protein